MQDERIKTRVIYVRVPNQLHRQLKATGVVLDKTMGHMVIEAIENYLSQPQEASDDDQDRGFGEGS